MNRATRLGTIAAAIVGAIAAAAWLVKDRLTGPAPAGEGTPLAVAPPPPIPEPEHRGDDDLSEISGIGPVYKTRLAEAGITSFAGLAKADATEIAEQIQAPVSRIQAWIDAARRRD